MKAFEKMEEFLANLQADKLKLTDQKNVLVMQRQAKVQELEEALLTGDGTEIGQVIEAIDNEMAGLEQRISVIDATLNGKRHSPTLTAIIWAVINEAREGIAGFHTKWDQVAGELAALDSQRLEIVARLGEIDRAARRLTSQATQAADYLPSPKPGAPSLAHGITIRHDRKSGIIFPDIQQIEKFFKGE